MRELIDTERAYVTELQSILDGYASKLNSEEMQVWIFSFSLHFLMLF